MTFPSQLLISKCRSHSQRILQVLCPVVNTHIIICKFLALYFHHDSPWSNVPNDCNRLLGGKRVREENLFVPYCKITSKSACCWTFYVFFLVVVGRFRSLIVVFCSLWVVSGHSLLFLVFSGRFLLVVGRFRSF